MVITKDADRLSRDKRQLIALLHIFAEAGVIEFSEGLRCDRHFICPISCGRTRHKPPSLGCSSAERNDAALAAHGYGEGLFSEFCSC